MTNKDIANRYAKHIASIVDKVWVSDNLPTLSRSERREILAIYKKHFKVVEYDSVTGVCKCWVVDPCELTATEKVGDFTMMNKQNGNISDPVKQSTRTSANIPTANVTKGVFLL